MLISYISPIMVILVIWYLKYNILIHIYTLLKEIAASALMIFFHRFSSFPDARRKLSFLIIVIYIYIGK